MYPKKVVTKKLFSERKKTYRSLKNQFFTKTLRKRFSHWHRVAFYDKTTQGQNLKLYCDYVLRVLVNLSFCTLKYTFSDFLRVQAQSETVSAERKTGG
jgi:hypothetical protein